MAAAQPPRTAAALVIGNEILTGKVEEQNVAALGRSLRQLGIRLCRVVTCPDDVASIVEELERLRGRYDIVFTSGGVGPTHDDVTLEAVARAFDQPRRRSARLAARLAEHFGDRLTDAHLRMAEVPAAARMIGDNPTSWPTIMVGNVFVLPGVPAIFRAKLEAIRPLIEGGAPFVSRALETCWDEGELAPLLDRLVAEHPAVEVGSYPRLGAAGWYVRLTVDGQDPGAVDAAVAAIALAIGDAMPVEGEEER